MDLAIMGQANTSLVMTRKAEVANALAVLRDVWEQAIIEAEDAKAEADADAAKLELEDTNAREVKL